MARKGKRSAGRQSDNDTDPKAPEVPSQQSNGGSGWEDRYRRMASERLDALTARLDSVNARFVENCGRPAPRSIEEMERDATRAGVPYADVQNGTFGSLLPYVEGHLLRVADAERFAELARQTSIAATGDSGTRERQPERRPRLKVEGLVLMIDGKPHPFKGGETTKRRLAEFTQALIEADGGFVTMSDYKVRQRNVQAQSPEVRDILNSEAAPGKGCCIPREKLWRN
jgi:hypothetical protein